MPATAAGNGPLAGVRVLDLCSIVMGPFATRILADEGAEVITIEPVETSGGSNRRMGRGRHPEFSGTALNLLRGKRMVSLDLKNPAARDAALAIGRSCDVVVTNLRPKPLARLGLTYADFCRVAPDIIYCQAQGFRSDSPRADDPAYDDVIQSECGVADAARQTHGVPRLAPTIMADKVCGITIAGAVAAALYHRARSGRGQRIEVPMMDVMRAFLLVEHGDGAISDDTAPAGYRRVLNPERGPQQTADGWVEIMPYSRAAYDALFGEHGRPDLLGDPRTEGRGMMVNARALYADLRPIIATRTTAYWLEFCDRHKIPVGRVVALDELVAGLPLADHPDVGRYRHIPPPVWFTGAGEPALRPARRHGADTRAVLREAGLDDTAINALVAQGAASEAIERTPA